MSCAADEPGTERGRAAAARGSAGAPGRGRGSRGASARRGWTADSGGAAKRGAVLAKCPGALARGDHCFGGVPAGAWTQQILPLTSPLPQLGEEGRSGSILVPLPPPWGKLMLKRAKRCPEGAACTSARGKLTGARGDEPPEM